MIASVNLAYPKIVVTGTGFGIHKLVNVGKVVIYSVIQTLDMRLIVRIASAYVLLIVRKDTG